MLTFKTVSQKEACFTALKHYLCVMRKQALSLTQYSCSLVAVVEGRDGSFSPLIASFGMILLAKAADTLYLETWLFCVTKLIHHCC